ncbi:flagellar biosynthesis anti-sigma factor FlgM [Geomonas sp. Red32]|nr:flagellar biosynthesis anti-sigma factor FlgM [Geomonas sp. Red32]
MKITNDAPQTAPVQQVNQPTATAPARKKPHTGKPAGDTVEISGQVDAEVQARQAEQAQRVAAIKEQVKAGNYEVDSRKVAEKMLARSNEK